MRTSEENVKISKDATVRFLKVMKMILSNIPKYGINTVSQFAASVGLLGQHIIESY